MTEQEKKKRLNELPYKIAEARKLSALYTKNNSSKKYYWNSKLKKLLEEQKTLQSSSSAVTGSNRIIGIAENTAQIPAREVEGKITSSGLRAAYDKAIKEKNWTEKSRLQNIMTEFRKTHLWKGYGETQSQALSSQQSQAVQIPAREVEGKITSSGLRAAYDKAINEKNWTEKTRLQTILTEFRKTHLWKGYRGGATGADGNNGATGIAESAVQIPAREVEEKITSSGLRAAYDKAIKEKNWTEKTRLQTILTEFRKTHLWKGFKNTESKSDNPKNSTTNNSFAQRMATAYKNGAKQDWVHTQLIIWLAKQSKVRKLGIANVAYDGRGEYPKKGTVINTPYIRDAINIKENGTTIEGYTINDTIFDTKYVTYFDTKISEINKLAGNSKPPLLGFEHVAHRDGIQLIPQDKRIDQYRSQYAGAKLSDVTVKDMIIKSKGSLQGVFSSDGAIEKIKVTGVTVDSKSAHGVKVMGMLSGTLEVTNKNGVAATFELLPLRLGGDRNIYITGFSKNSSYQYGTVDNGSSNAEIIDNRKKQTKAGTYYNNFDMDKFLSLMEEENKESPTSDLKILLDRIEANARLSNGK